MTKKSNPKGIQKRILGLCVALVMIFAVAIPLTACGAKTYAVTVNNGTGGGKFKEGATVTITATIPSGKEFDVWTSPDVTFANASAATTTFKMPKKEVVVTATFKDTDTPVELMTLTQFFTEIQKVDGNYTMDYEIKNTDDYDESGKIQVNGDVSYRQHFVEVSSTNIPETRVLYQIKGEKTDTHAHGNYPNGSWVYNELSIKHNTYLAISVISSPLLILENEATLIQNGNTYTWNGDLEYVTFYHVTNCEIEMQSDNKVLLSMSTYSNTGNIRTITATITFGAATFTSADLLAMME